MEPNILLSTGPPDIRSATETLLQAQGNKGRLDDEGRLDDFQAEVTELWPEDSKHGPDDVLDIAYRLCAYISLSHEVSEDSLEGKASSHLIQETWKNLLQDYYELLKAVDSETDGLTTAGEAAMGHDEMTSSDDWDNDDEMDSGDEEVIEERATLEENEPPDVYVNNSQVSSAMDVDG